MVRRREMTWMKLYGILWGGILFTVRMVLHFAREVSHICGSIGTKWKILWRNIYDENLFSRKCQSSREGWKLIYLKGK